MAMWKVALKFVLATVILFVSGIIWHTAVIGMLFGLLVGAILLAATFFAPPLNSGACDL